MKKMIAIKNKKYLHLQNNTKIVSKFIKRKGKWDQTGWEIRNISHQFSLTNGISPDQKDSFSRKHPFFVPRRTNAFLILISSQEIYMQLTKSPKTSTI